MLPSTLSPVLTTILFRTFSAFDTPFDVSLLFIGLTLCSTKSLTFEKLAFSENTDTDLPP